ncbi:Ktr system potassium transporter B [Salipaludibacillus keqinensis]|uniref:Ktr system potassium transporter B n=1 Tax=Salipaludibacillus keqinensis TaxID=2045207 RepID=A0A323TET6_9BACI|nr:TrkH family potassium uptake protein [Salipaludibacillus keqinensis]PYZ92564.1 Ktr system potassium transporter B [Salipaludibacillus keqinensis]
MKMMNLFRNWTFSPPQFLAIGFGLAIIFGTLILMLPWSTTGTITWMNALFTATSATTVTGLVVVDTGSDFTVFGQVVIMILIKIGGLGLMTFAIMTVLVLGKRIGLKERVLLQEALNQHSIGGVVRLIKILFIFSMVMELIAAVLLSFRWVPEYGWGFGIYTSIFHSISAFNNAGFSLWSDSLSGYVGDPVINLLITFLFITGGIGFTVLYDVMTTKKFRFLALHTKIMLVGTLIVNLVAVIIIFLLEFTNPLTLGGLSLGDQIWASYFQAVTPRTAGFNTIEIGDMNPGSIVFTLLLMFIGAGSASTGSGVKLTTFLVIILAVMTYLQGKQEPVIFSRRIGNEIVNRAMAIVVISVTVVFISILALSISEPAAPFMLIVFEAFSAFGTVGLSMGLTGDLSELGKQIIIVLMFIGRIGPLTLAFALAKSSKPLVSYPKGDVFTG